MVESGAEAAYRRRLALVNQGLESVLPGKTSEPRRLHEAMRHAVFAGGGGKRLRPVILLTVASDLDVPEELALPAALALELVHCYSLVHDDLPCMDNAPTRRGAPSVHAAFGYADAVLAGDALLTLAFELLGRAGNSGLPRPGELVVELARAAGSVGMVGGQHADLAAGPEVAERLPGADPPVLKIHRLKTGKLHAFAFCAPGYLAASPVDATGGAAAPPARLAAAPAGSADPKARVEALRAAGENFGLAFQIADDLRDSAGDDRAPNFARAAGPDRAREAARAAIGRCLETLAGFFGERGESVALVRGAAEKMGL